MHPLILELTTRDLATCWLFYSAIGMKWNPPMESPPPSVQDEPDDLYGWIVPDLMGILHGTEMFFYYDANASQTGEGPLFQIEYETEEQLTEAVDKLEKGGVLVLEPNPEDSVCGTVRDPDGRRFRLCPPGIYIP